MPISNAELIGIESRLAYNRRSVVKKSLTTDACENESELHGQIIDWLKSKGWYWVHSRMDRKTTTQLGVVDFIIAAPGGVTFWIEAKAKGNKPTPPQIGVAMMLERVGHRHATVWNFEQFLRAVDL